MLSDSFQTNYVLVKPHNTKFTLRRGKSRKKAYCLGTIYGYCRGCLADASKKGCLGAVKYLVGCGADVHWGNDHALRWASVGGHLGVVKYLIGVE